MSELRFTFAPSIGFVLLALSFGCATERPTGSTSEGTLPTLNLSDPIILHMSDPIDSIVFYDPVSREYTMQLPSELLSPARGQLDVRLEYYEPDNCRLANVYVFNYMTSEWFAIEDKRTAQPCLGFWESRRVTLLPFQTRLTESLISRDGQLRLHGDLVVPIAQVFEVPLGYRQQLLSLSATNQAVAWTGQELLVWLQWIDSTLARVDSLLWLDRAGQRMQVREVGSGSVDASGVADFEWSGDETWVSTYISGGRRYYMLDESEVAIRHFDYRPEIQDGILQLPQNFLWVNGEFWILEHRLTSEWRNPEPQIGAPSITVVDPWASLDSSVAVVMRSFPLGEFSTGIRDVAFDGERICGLRHQEIVRWSLDGTLIDALPLPVRGVSFTWDGEAFWIVHNGTWEASTDLFLLSRFYPR